MAQEIVWGKYSVEDIGGMIAESKKRYSWTFKVGGRDHICSVKYSLMSNKIGLSFDGAVELPAES
jgi:hypothetical protein